SAEFTLERSNAVDRFNEQFKKKNLTKDETAFLKKSTDHFGTLAKYAQQSRHEKYQFWAANRLRLIGLWYEWDGGKAMPEGRSDPVEAFRVYQLGLPGKAAPTAAHVRLLAARNALFGKPDFQEELKTQKLTPPTLLADAQLGVRLAEEKHIWIFPS